MGIAFLFGATGIVVIRMLVENRWSAPAASAFALFIVFCLMYYYIQNHIDDREQEGDNLYYLGLLFTLVSLMYALVVLFWLPNNDENLMDRTYELLGNFGVALVSTVAGIIARIFVQNYQIGDSYRGHVNTETQWIGRDGGDTGIGTASRELQRELLQATYAFNRFSNITKRTAFNTRMNLHRTAEAISREMQTKARATMNDLTSGYRQVADETTELQTAIAKSGNLMNETYKGVTSSLTKTNSALENFGQNLNGLAAIDRQAREVAETLSKHGGILAATWQSHKEELKVEHEHIQQCIEDMQTSRKHLHDELFQWRNRSKDLIQQEEVQWNEQMERLRGLFLNVEEVMKNWIDLGARGAHAANLIQTFETTQTRISTLIQDIAEGFQRIAQETNEAQRSTADVGAEFKKLTSTIGISQPALEQFGQALKLHTEGLVKLDQQTKATSEVVSRWSEQSHHMLEILEKAELATERWTALESQVIATTEVFKDFENAVKTSESSSKFRWWRARR